MIRPPDGGHPEPRYCLRWTCPRCHRSWIAEPMIAAAGRINARVDLSAVDTLHCHRCDGHWEPWECGIDWQSQNEAADAALQEHP